MNTRIRCLLVVALLACCAAWPIHDAAANDVDEGIDDNANVELLEQEAFRAAVDRVAPSVVRIETVGGLERVGTLLFGTGPTTGLIVDRDGYIVSSAFNFVNRPSSILVRLSDGSLKPAVLVATDHNRHLVLLKIDVDEPLPVPDVAPAAEMRIGQWAIAVGRVFESSRPNVSVGIISAIGRIWGKAVQTDAAVSPNNYGGPLIDIRGRVLGVLAPLSPQSAEEITGYQWYDSGIGFAVDAEHVMKTLPRLKKGEDLHGGVIGIALRGQNPAIGEPVIAACHPNSPAAKAGLKAGDRIVEIEGRNIVRAAGIKAELSRRYAGTKVRVVAVRDGKRIEAEVELVAKLQPYQHPFLGVLPMRLRGERPGVAVRYVYPGGPAAAAKVEPGDVIVSLQGKPIENRDELLQRIATFQPGEKVEIEVRRADDIRKLKLALAGLPEDLPPEKLPPARDDVQPSEGERAAVGTVALKIPELANDARAYVPEAYDPAVPHGLVIFLHAPGSANPFSSDTGQFDWEKLLARWKPHCDSRDLILLAPESADSKGWKPGDATMIGKFIDKINADYTIDSARLVLHGHEGGGTLAYLAARQHRELARAVVAVDAPVGSPLPEIDPLHRMAVYTTTARKSPRAGLIEKTIARIRNTKIPVTVKDLGEVPRYLNDDELAELARWIDMLDRI